MTDTGEPVFIPGESKKASTVPSASGQPPTLEEELKGMGVKSPEELMGGISPVTDKPIKESVPEADRMRAQEEASEFMKLMTAAKSPEEQNQLKQSMERFLDKKTDEAGVVAEAKNLKMSKQEVIEYLERAGEKPEKIERIAAQLEEGDSMNEMIDKEEKLTPEQKAELKNQVQTLKEEEAKTRAALSKDIADMNDDEKALLEEMKDPNWIQSKLASLTKVETWLKGISTGIIAIFILYIFLLKLYAGAAAKKR